MFAWIHHLIDEGYFRSIEIFFLFAGHTHSPLDQNFSVVGHAVNRASFIGSIIAMQELFKAAHDITNEKSKLTRITETHYLEFYHNNVQKYDPVIDTLIRNYGGPHRYLVEMNDSWGISDTRYMWQSPETGFTNHWLPLRPSLLEDAVDLTADIDLSPMISLGGKERVLAKLKVNATQNFGELLSSSASRKAASNDILRMQTFNDNLPSIEQLESESMVSQDIIYIGEAANGRSSTKNAAPKLNKKLHKTMMSEVEGMMVAENTNKSGYLRFLKRSLVKDVEWLDKRPDIIPNPKMWREQTKKATTTDDSATTASISDSTGTGKKEKEKKDPVYELAVTRLMQFNSGATQMAKTAKHMLELHRAGDRFGFSNSYDICTATRSFREVLLTQRDVTFYENIETISLITQHQERLVTEEEARPWQLLRLPSTMPEVDIRRTKMRKEQEEIFAKKQLSLSKLLNKVQDGFDITREVITRSGKETIFEKNLEDMNLDQLMTILKNIALPGRSNLKTKEARVAAIRKYLSDHPTKSLKSICGEEDESNATQATIPGVVSASASSGSGTNSATSGASEIVIVTTAPIIEVATPGMIAVLSENIPLLPVDDDGQSDSVIETTSSEDTTAILTHVPLSTLEKTVVPGVGGGDLRVTVSAGTATIHTWCPVKECEESADAYCDMCQLKFCSALHGPHMSHTCQQLKAGYTFSGNWATPPEVQIAPFSSNDTATSSFDAVSNIAIATSSPIKIAEKLPPLHINEDIDVVNMLGGSEKNAQHSKRKYETIAVGIPVAVSVSDTAVKDVAMRIQRIVKLDGSSLIGNLKRKLNDKCYHVDFLILLSNELKVDISRALDTRRPTRAGVMNELITKLL